MTGNPRMHGADVAVLGADDLADFVHEHYVRLVRLAGVITRRPEISEDAVQGALERAWRHRRSLDDPDRLRAWLDRIVVREALRLASRRRGLLGRILGSGEEDSVEVAERHHDSPAMLDLRLALSRLSPEQRAVVGLHLYAGYSVEETAQLIGIPPNTVRSRLRVARERMRHLLKEVGS